MNRGGKSEIWPTLNGHALVVGLHGVAEDEVHGRCRVLGFELRR